MVQEEIELLLKDICARLPYKPQVEIIKDGTSITDKLTTATIKYLEYGYWEVKPYLYPLSSMTKEQSKELEEIDPEFYSLICSNGEIYVSMDVRGYDWLNRNHFDYRGLIPMGLAIDCTNLNIY